MASRGSFQKRQKEAARKEKRQMKLDRRQGRAPIVPTLNGNSSEGEGSEERDWSENPQDESPGSPELSERATADID